MTMVMQWVLYCIVLSIALAFSARFAEAAARAFGRSTRWCWAVALMASVMLPFASYMRPVHIPAVETPISYDILGAPSSASLLPPASVTSPQRTPVETGILLWATSSLLALVAIGISYVRLRHARRSWTQAEVSGINVWVSDDTGPAALGVLTSGIVVPRWVLSFEERSLSLMMLHEREHLRAGDPRLMLLSVLLVAAMPWNPIAWIMVGRLRLAIEIDCDRRVLSHEPDFAAYGAVLLEVGRQRSSPTFALSTFAEPRSQLEERIRLIAERSKGTRLLRAAAMLVLALPLGGAAYGMHAPMHARVVVDEPAGIRVTSAADTTAPRIMNMKDVFARLDTDYPESMKNRRVDGSAWVSIHVAMNGIPDRTVITTSSGYPAMDSAALRISKTIRFTPSMYGGRRVASTTSVRLRFAKDPRASTVTVVRPSAPAPVGAKSPAVAKPSRTDVRTGTAHVTTSPIVPTDTIIHIQNAPNDTVDRSTWSPGMPVKYHAQVTNRARVQAVADESYPSMLRDAGIGGTTAMWVHIDAKGNATDARVQVSSGSAALDSAALKVAQSMQFEPAVIDGRVQNAWVEAPVTFTAPEQARSPKPAMQTPPLTDLSVAPFVTPMTVVPRLVNTSEVEIAIALNYPAVLRDAGIGGKTVVWFFINEDGRVVKTLIHTRSGYDALDEAAMKVAPVLRFSPAENKSKPVAVWVQIPIVFTVK